MVAVCKVSWDEQEDGKHRTFLEELHLNKHQAYLVISMRKHFVYKAKGEVWLPRPCGKAVGPTMSSTVPLAQNQASIFI
jgi:hypothetical protein